MKYKLTISKYEGHEEHVKEFNNWDEARSAYDGAAQTMLMFSKEKMSVSHMDKRHLVCEHGAVVLNPIE